MALRTIPSEGFSTKMPEITLLADRDAHVYEGTPNGTFGATLPNDLITGSASLINVYYSFIHFDISSLVAGAILDSATLRLNPESGSVPHVMRITGIRADFVENTVTWNNKPSNTNMTVYEKSFTNDFVHEQYVDIDVTDLVNGWIKGYEPNFGMQLYTTQTVVTNVAVTWDSSETTNPPQLVLSYHLPLPIEATTTRMTQYLPNFWWDSKVLESIYNAVSPEINLLKDLLRTQSSQSDTELQNYLDNDVGWGHERLINQQFLISANSFIVEKFRNIHQVQTDIESYVDLRTRFLLFAQPGDTNTVANMQDQIGLIGTISNFVENESAYTIALSVLVDKPDFTEAALQRIIQTRPAHLGGNIYFYTVALNDSPPAELEDGSVISASGAIGSIS